MGRQSVQKGGGKKRKKGLTIKGEKEVKLRGKSGNQLGWGGTPISPELNLS